MVEKPEAKPLAFRLFSGEERIENMRQVFFGNPAPRVPDRNPDKVPVRVEAARQAQHAASGMASMALKMRLITHCWSWLKSPCILGRSMGKVRFHPDVLKGHFVPAQIDAFVQDFIDIHGAELEPGLPGKSQEVGYDLGTAFEFTFHERKIALKFRGQFLREISSGKYPESGGHS